MKIKKNGKMKSPLKNKEEKKEEETEESAGFTKPGNTGGGSYDVSDLYVSPKEREEYIQEQEANKKAREAAKRPVLILREKPPKNLWMRDEDNLGIFLIHKLYVPGKRLEQIMCIGKVSHCPLCEAGFHPTPCTLYEFIDLDGYESKRDGKVYKNFSCFYVASEQQRAQVEVLINTARKMTRKGISDCLISAKKTGSGAGTTHLFQVEDTDYEPPIEARNAKDLRAHLTEYWFPLDEDTLEAKAREYTKAKSNEYLNR